METESDREILDSIKESRKMKPTNTNRIEQDILTRMNRVICGMGMPGDIVCDGRYRVHKDGSWRRIKP